MGSSSSGKKHKKDKKHRHRDEEAASGDEARRHKHREKSRHRQRLEVINVPESDSDSSDCVEVPVDQVKSKSTKASSEREISAPPPPVLSKSSDYERERKDRERHRSREADREREKHREREKERERLREYERAKEKREMERRRERDRERERSERDRERDDVRGGRPERDRASERGERERREPRDRPPQKERSPSPVPENGAGDVLSIEETNKLRAKLGLKPLEVDSGPTKPSTSAAAAAASSEAGPGEKDLSSYKDEWGEFLHKPADNIKDKKEAEKMREKLKQRKEKRFLEERLARIRTLGESDEEGDDVSKWVERNKRAIDEKKQAEQRAKMLEEMDDEFGVNALVEKEREEKRRKAYSDKHLKGLRVEHDMEDFTEGRTIILTLKDKEVLDEEDGDALVNVNMLDDERYRKNVDNKKKNPLSYGYNVYEEQFDELGNPIERNILEKYDEDVDGMPTKKKAFVIGENNAEHQEHKRKILEIKTKLAKKRLETLADIKTQLASDTLTEAEIAQFRKPKKKVKKLRQKLKAEDLVPIADEPIEQHLGSRNGRQARNTQADPAEETADVKDDVKVEEEDDDLERMLSKARRIKQKENIIRKPLPVDIEEIKMEVKVEEPEEDPTLETIGADGFITLNATAEFCRTLGDIPTYGMAGNRNVDSNEIMDFEEEVEREDTTAIQHMDDDDEAKTSHGTWNSVDPEDAMRPVDFDAIAEEVEDVAILDEEPDVGAGVANALRLALSKGYLEKEEHNRPSNSKMAHLQAKNYSIDDKATGEDEKFGRRERFYTGPLTEFKDKETFKPNVKLEYIDDNGRILNLKEAFRYLSHKFHGKGPGKNKIEKRLKKMEQDGLMKTMSSTDTPLGTLTMLQQKQRETKTPYVVLSGGKQNLNTPTTISKYK